MRVARRVAGRAGGHFRGYAFADVCGLLEPRMCVNHGCVCVGAWAGEGRRGAVSPQEWVHGVNRRLSERVWSQVQQ